MSDFLKETLDDPDEKPSRHSFIIQMWLDISDAIQEERRWRGQIIHVPGDEREYFSDLSEALNFIVAHLNAK